MRFPSPSPAQGELMSRAVVKKLSSAEFADKAVVYIDLAAGQTLPQLATIHRNMQARAQRLWRVVALGRARAARGASSVRSCQCAELLCLRGAWLAQL